MKQDETKTYWVRVSHSFYVFLYDFFSKALRLSWNMWLFSLRWVGGVFFPGASGGGQGGESHSLDVSWLSTQQPLRFSRPNVGVVTAKKGWE